MEMFPLTTIGKFLASIIMILGYAIIAVPTGIVSAAIAKSASKIHSHVVFVLGKDMI